MKTPRKKKPSFEKSALVNFIARTTNLPPEDCEHIIQIASDTVVNVLAKGKSVQIRGFGTFAPRPREAANPEKTSSANSVFTPGKVFREAVKKNHSR